MVEMKARKGIIRNCGGKKETFPNILSGQLGWRNDIDVSSFAKLKNLTDARPVNSSPTNTIGFDLKTKRGNIQKR